MDLDLSLNVLSEFDKSLIAVFFKCSRIHTFNYTSKLLIINTYYSSGFQVNLHLRFTVFKISSITMLLCTIF